MDASILLPPTGTPLTGIDFVKRLPCGDVERTRRVSANLPFFFAVRAELREKPGHAMVTSLPALACPFFPVVLATWGSIGNTAALLLLTSLH